MSEEERIAKMETKLEGQESHSPVAGGRKHTSEVGAVCGQGLAAHTAASVSTATVKAMTVKDLQGIPRRYGAGVLPSHRCWTTPSGRRPLSVAQRVVLCVARLQRGDYLWASRNVATLVLCSDTHQGCNCLHH